PPTSAIRNKVQGAVRRPFRLEDRLIDSTGDSHRFVYRSVFIQFADPKLRTIPRHIGVTPGQPGQSGAVRTKPRRGVKIISRDQSLSGVFCPEVDAHESINGFPVTRMVLAHAEKKISPAVDLSVGVAHVRSGSERPRLRARSLDIEALVGKIREDNRAVRNRVVAAAVFVHPGAGIKADGSSIRHLSIRRTVHNNLSPALLRSPLDPIDIAAVEPYLFKPNFACRNNGGRNRALS